MSCSTGSTVEKSRVQHSSQMNGSTQQMSPHAIIPGPGDVAGDSTGDSDTARTPLHTDRRERRDGAVSALAQCHGAGQTSTRHGSTGGSSEIPPYPNSAVGGRQSPHVAMY